LDSLLELPALKSLAESLQALHEPDEKENLATGLAENLRRFWKSSVSRLEEFAQVRSSFVRSGLRANERRCLSWTRANAQFPTRCFEDFPQPVDGGRQALARP